MGIKKKKADKVDRKVKTIKIGKFKLSYEKVCALSLVLLFVFSSAGMYFSGGSKEQPEVIREVQVGVMFDTTTQITETVSIEEGWTASQVFDQLVVIDGTNTENGLRIDTITYKNFSKTIDDSYEWVFYKNGVLLLKDITKVGVEEGDIVELRYEENPFK